jgi:uncharacterized phage protein (TIGR02216 family)
MAVPLKPQLPLREPFPWDAAMRFGLGRLRLPPDHFWAMTPAELAAAARAFAPPRLPALDRNGLAALLAQFPDHEESPDG